MREIPYEELDKHFTAPKNLNERPFFSYKRLPRKMKKKLKKLNVPYYLYKGNINILLWIVMEENYRRFIIHKLSNIYGADYKAGCTRGE